MKIVMLCDFDNEQLEYQENLLVKYYVKHGHAVTVIASTFESVFDYYADRHDNRWPARDYEHGGARIIKLRYRYNILNRLRAYTTIADILERERPDLIFVHDIMLNVLEAIRYKRRQPQCRMIMDYHADYSNSGRNWLSLKILHGVIRKWYLDGRGGPEQDLSDRACERGFPDEAHGIAHEEMELLPLGADTDLGEEIRARGDGPVLRRSLGIPPEHTVIFSGGKLAPAKRTELLIEAVNRLADPTLHLVIVGEAGEADRAYQQSLVESARANSNIRFAGWLGKIDIYRYLAMADLAVFPASQSILWQQAISMGLPLIVGDAGHQDISYLNGHGNIIVLAREHIDRERLTAAISSVVGDRTLRRRMSAGALRVADEMLNWNTLIDKTLRFNRETATDHDQTA